MNKLKELLLDSEEALKELEKLNNKIADILFLLYNVEDKTDYKIKELNNAINQLQKI